MPFDLPDIKLPDIELPVWLNKGEAAKLSTSAAEWFTLLKEWALLPVRQDPMTCTEPVLDLLAWQRDIQRFRHEPLEIYRLRVRHAYANARDAGVVDGFKKIFRRMGVGNVEIEERMADLDWDVINLTLDDSQMESASLIDILIRDYGRTCRRYGYKTVNNFPMAVVPAEFSNDSLTDTVSLMIPTDSVQVKAVEFCNDFLTEEAWLIELTGTLQIRAAEFCNDHHTETISILDLTGTVAVQVAEFCNDSLTSPITMEANT